MTRTENLEIVSLSDVGKRRPHNEDSTLCDPELGLAVLADGMGGYKAGEVASAIAVTVIHSRVKTSIKALKAGKADSEAGHARIRQLVEDAIIHSNSEIYATAKRDPQCQGMGTTLGLILFHNTSVTIAHVGDSRLYRWRRNQFEQLTTDHSLYQEMIDRGLYTPEEAAISTPRNLVTRALGIEPGVQADIMQEPVLPGDIFLLCSDGLNDMVNDEEIHLTLSKYSANLAQAAEELVRLANVRGGKDNISVILARLPEGVSATTGGTLEKLIRRFF